MNLKAKLKDLLETIIEQEEDDFTENEYNNLIEEDKEIYDFIKGLRTELPKDYLKRLAEFDHTYVSAQILHANLKHIKITKPIKRRAK
jgi:hypothetical protein